jgi:Rieske Fe-S protein
MDHHNDRAGTPGQGPNPSHDSVRAADGEAERVEDYLQLEEFVAQLQAERRPRRPRRLAPAEARVYQTAALLRAARPGATDPDPEFAARLRARLDAEVRGAGGTRPLGGVSRRNLLAGGLSAAAAAAGVAVGIGVDRATQPNGNAPWNTDLVPSGTWLAVAPVAAIPVGGVQRFATDTLVGFVRHTSQGFSALSGACTHMGCLVNWNGAARTFDCPCHGGRFLETGAAAPASTVAYRPLPTIRTMVQDNQVYVFVPASGGTDPNGGGTNSGGSGYAPSR